MCQSPSYPNSTETNANGRRDANELNSFGVVLLHSDRLHRNARLLQHLKYTRASENIARRSYIKMMLDSEFQRVVDIFCLLIFLQYAFYIAFRIVSLQVNKKTRSIYLVLVESKGTVAE